MASTRNVQERLRALGYDPGPPDGIFGRKTIAAVTAFQRDKKLEVKFPGTVGTKTLSALGLEYVAVADPLPPWVTEARRFLGKHEVKDAKTLDRALRLDSSEIPWCGAFQAMVLATVLPREAIPANPLWALNWQKFGQPIEGPAMGAIVTFKRPSGGHVAQIVGHDDTYWHCLGGNQSNAVTITKIAKSRQHGPLRWPTTFALATTPMSKSRIAVTISHNEA